MTCVKLLEVNNQLPTVYVNKEDNTHSVTISLNVAI